MTKMKSEINGSNSKHLLSLYKYLLSNLKNYFYQFYITHKVCNHKM